MDVQVQRSFTVPPPATKSEEVPLTVFSLFMPSYYYTILFTFTSPNPTNAALLALTATLPHFPLLTARLIINKPRRRHGAGGGDPRPCFITGDQGSGALVVEAAVSASPLSDHLPLVPSPELALLHPPAVFGNLALTALSRTAVGKLVADGGLADAAALVRTGVRAVNGRYFQSFIDFGALHGDEELVPIWEKPSAETTSCFLDLEVDSWLRLGFDRLDFGLSGRLVGILPARIPLDGVVVLIPSMREAGGIDVLVALHEKPARVLKDIAYTID
ncbi:hypothetical protein HU200_048631 [Digitaria exilis]|uniref:Uncharacterized protein n=1 Tax=Digitaria exilis TaxID=1010633 RepID=A0A835AV37_9POAL|nr:hypothetical protein HU200_048631 [Digitaria exilis]